MGAASSRAPVIAAHFSDQHFSIENLVEASRCSNFAVDQSVRYKADVAFLTGDLTDHRMDASSPPMYAMAQMVQRQANQAPVLVLQGTFYHEPRGLLNLLGLIGAKHPIYVADKIEQVGLTFDGRWIPIDDDTDPSVLKVAVSCLPAVNKAELVPYVGAENARSSMGDSVADVLASFAERNASLRSAGVPTVLVSHGTVDGSLNENGISMVNQDHEFKLGALYAAGADATLLGHIHAHQEWKRGEPGSLQVVAYAGSVGCYHQGEIGNKYCLMWNLQAGNPSFEAIKTPSREMVDVRFDGPPDLDELQALAAQVEGKHVRVIYSVDEEHIDSVSERAIKAILGGTADVKFQRTVLPIQRQRCAGISRETDLGKRVEMWCEATGTESAPIVGLLSDLVSESVEDLVGSIIRSKPQRQLMAA